MATVLFVLLIYFCLILRSISCCLRRSSGLWTSLRRRVRFSVGRNSWLAIISLVDVIPFGIGEALQLDRFVWRASLLSKSSSMSGYGCSYILILRTPYLVAGVFLTNLEGVFKLERVGYLYAHYNSIKRLCSASICNFLSIS